MNNRFTHIKSAEPWLQRIFLWLALVFSTSTFGQVGQLLLSEIKNNTGKPILRLDTRNSFVGNAAVRIKGIQAGLSFGDYLELGLGYHSNRLAVKTPLEVGGTERVILDYVALFLEYEFFRKGKFRAAYPMQIGFGATTVARKKSGNYLAIPYEALLVVSYFPIKYCSVGLGLGYRVMIVGNNSYGLNFNSPIYSIKFNLIFQEILAAVKN